MGFSSIFTRQRSPGSDYAYYWIALSDGVHFHTGGAPAPKDALATSLASAEVGSLLDQLTDEDMASAGSGGYSMTWEQVHELLRSRVYASSRALLQLPPSSPLLPRLTSQGSLTDAHFTITVSGWCDEQGNSRPVEALVGSVARCGGKLGLLSAQVWRLLEALNSFADRPAQQRDAQATRRHWGIIRRLAVEADAHLDDFLVRSVVLTPDKLDLAFRKSSVGATSIVEVFPVFDGAPDRWLEFFDKVPSVPEHFNIPTKAGAVHVALTEPVREVLAEIKRWPGRRAAGARAEAFLLNPFAALGEAASEVIDSEQFAAAKDRAGIHFERFRPYVVADATGFPSDIGIDIDTQDGARIRRPFESDQRLRDFIAALDQRLQRGLQLLAWDEYELELDGDAPTHLAALQVALNLRDKPTIVISRNGVFDLSSYSDRIVGIGEADDFISAYIVKKPDDEGWFRPAPLTSPQTDRNVPLPPEEQPNTAADNAAAKEAGENTVGIPGDTRPLPVDAFEQTRVAPASEDALGDAQPRRPRTLLIKGNIDAVDHRETREELLSGTPDTMERPSALKQTVALRQHQVAGIARLQHLFRLSPGHCRGVLLADDMGLGKTLQVLTFMAWALEREPALPPALIVAPVSLLDNWQEEIDRFFEPGAIAVSTAYGDHLSSFRVSRASIDVDLQRDGLVRFLKPDWRGRANVVLTTYETLRDLEFSFARETWSILVCDEAQKIKNPNAMVTRAAKKLKVRFRVACTGTPVENSLADLWCLFDFIQPGLLGALNEFGKVYGRAIERGEDKAPTQLEKLRRLIEPQVIRRTKAEVAKDLPQKIEEPDCRVSISDAQRELYVGALRLFSEPPIDDEQGRIHHLGLLQHLRLVCADPRQYGIETFVPEDPLRYRRKAPKMDWLLKTLRAIRAKGEKALIFAEHRDVQRLLQHYIKAEYGFAPRIVNGDTSVSAKAQMNRRKAIKDFQRAPGFGVIILSPLAVGFGVNIQAANHVIHYLRHWNPAKEDQATDRAYRIGQTKDVHVYCPLTVAGDFKTFDVKLDELLRRKRALAGDMLQGSGAIAGSEFDLAEIVPDGQTTLRSQPITLDLIERSSPSFFEAIVATLWQKQGYRCHLTQQSDAGVDVVGIRGTEGVLLQCKSSTSTGRELGWEAVRDVVGGTAIYAEQFPTVRFRRIGVTNQAFNGRAHDRARANGVDLIEQEQLARLIAEYPIGTLDVLAIRSAPRI